MDDFKEILLSLVIPLLAICTFMFLISFGMYEYEINVGQANFVTVTDGGNVIYEGKKAFISLDSGGMTTTVTVYKSLFPFNIIERTYSSPHITVSPTYPK